MFIPRFQLDKKVDSGSATLTQALGKKKTETSCLKITDQEHIVQD